MTATRSPSPSDLESAQHFVSALRPDQILNALENLSEPGAGAEFGAEYLLLIRGMLLRRLDSFSRGRRGLVSVPRADPP